METIITYNLNHIHLKSLDPGKTAGWWVETFNFKIIADTTRDAGDRFIRCRSENGVAVNIYGPLDGQSLPENDAGTNLGLEHIAFVIEEIDAEIERL